MTEGMDPPTEQVTAFERARFEYCALGFQEESGIKEQLERKAETYLAFITLFLGAVFLNLDFLLNLGGVLTQSANPFASAWLAYALLIGSLVSVVITMAAIIWAMRLQSYIAGYPADVMDSLFSPDSKYLTGRDEPSLLRAAAMTYADALTINRRLNESKSKALKVGSYFVFVSIALMTLFIGTIIYLLASQ